MPSRAITFAEFNNFARDLGLGVHVVGTDVFKVKLITTIPLVTDETNAAYTEVTGDNYTAGGIDVALTHAAGVAPQWIWQTAVDTVWGESAGGFTTAKAAVLSNVTKAKAISFADITVDAGTTPVSSAAQPVDINWNNITDILTIN